MKAVAPKEEKENVKMKQQPDVQNHSLYVSVVWMGKLQDLPLKWKLF
jgi:hypothetical protein